MENLPRLNRQWASIAEANLNFRYFLNFIKIFSNLQNFLKILLKLLIKFLKFFCKFNRNFPILSKDFVEMFLLMFPHLLPKNSGEANDDYLITLIFWIIFICLIFY